MNTVIYLQSICILLLMASGGFLLCQRHGAAMVCLAASLLVSIAVCLLARQSQRMMAFLIGQTKPREGDKVTETPLPRKRLNMLLYANQINPHFLYNTLDSIRGQALAGGQAEIALMTEKLSRFFRYYISSRGHIVKLSEEIQNVQDYFGIQQYRFGERMHMHLEIEDDNALAYYLPKLTLQPIVENAIAHGIEKHAGKGNIWVKVRVTEKNVYLNIIDDGVGMPLKKLWQIREQLAASLPDQTGNDDTHTGIAIQNVNARIQLCFGPEYGLNYRSIVGAGTNVEIILPVVDDFSRVQLENKLRDADP